MICPKTIIFQRDGGTGDMGDVTDETDRTARFSLPGRFSLVFVRAHFGDANGTADMTLNIDSGHGQFFDLRQYTFPAVGRTAADGDADGHLRIPEEELIHWTYEAGDAIVFEWTNPDSGNIHWGLEVGLRDASV
jgi:hypothetical protein